MSTSQKLVPILQGLTVAGLAVAAVLLAWPPNVIVAPLEPTLPALAAAVPVLPTTSASLTDSIVNANIFSLTREAPDSRTFVAAPVDPISDTTFTNASTANAGVGDSLATTNGDPVPHLYGVVNGPLGTAVLLRLDPARRGSRLFHIGEGTAGFRVRSIGADRVELDGPSGAVVLTLTSKGETP